MFPLAYTYLPGIQDMIIKKSQDSGTNSDDTYRTSTYTERTRTKQR